ncbi:MAG: acyltransferase domain-containing protein, partial [Clostridia bacterium]|nr:acyltransferase domain-containing protein [Clostridia bacterium]
MLNYELLEYVSLSEDLKNKICNLDIKSQKQIEKLSKKFAKGYTVSLGRKDPITKLAVALKSAEKTLLKYRDKGIDEEVFKATFDDIRIWCENYDNKGLDNIGWIKNHVKFELFKIGRLQFQFYKCRLPYLNYSNFPFSRGEKVINIHIPQGEKLDIEECKKSICKANEFFKTYFPKYKYNYYFCESWLLFEGNRKFMDPNSNIVKFMNMFDICGSVDFEKQTFERVFGIDMQSK